MFPPSFKTIAAALAELAEAMLAPEHELAAARHEPPGAEHPHRRPARVEPPRRPHLHDEPQRRAAAGARMQEPAASYSPRPLRAKYHRR